MMLVVVDAESDIIYAQGKCTLRNLVQIGKPIRLRVDLYGISGSEIRGGLCFDGTSHLQQVQQH